MKLFVYRQPVIQILKRSFRLCMLCLGLQRDFTMLEIQDLYDFSIQYWYENFKSISIKTLILELPKCLLNKLQQDYNCEVPLEETCHEEYKEKVKNILNSLQGPAFIKNNWHAPMDAKAFSFGNELKVHNISDLLLYLSASTIILEDFASQPDFPYVIAFKPWLNIHPASEFRCIVINNTLRGITPRDWPTYYEHFKEEGPKIIEILKEFFEDNIKEKFPRKHYTFDVIVDYPEKPLIMDFGPLTNKTNLYAFSWKEIYPLMNVEESCTNYAPIFRFLESDIGIVNKADALYHIANSLTS